MLLTIGKRFEFAAAHRLPEHGGKCQRPPGHNYILEVEVAGELQTSGSAHGMVLDYYIIKDVVTQAILEPFDHQNLNVVLRDHFPGQDPEKRNVTTAENIVVLFANLLAKAFAKAGYAGVLSSVRLQETPGSWATYCVSGFKGRK